MGIRIRVNVFGEPDVLELSEQEPLKPAADEIVVTMKAVGINPVDGYIRAGNYGVLPKLPYTPGFDGAGVIRELGKGVKNFSVGERVFISGSLTGTYAEETVCQVAHLHRLPAGLSFEQGAAIGIPYATAYRALFHKAEVFAGKTILVHGASGGVGVAAIQLARAAGLRILATVGSPEAQALMKSMGVLEVFFHSSPGYEKEILKATEGNGVDLILEMLANKNLEMDFGLITKGGRIVVVGCRGEVTVNPRLIMKQEATVQGMMLANATKGELDEIYAALEGLAEEGTIVPVIGKVFPLRQAREAHEAIRRPGAHGKIVLVP